MSLRTLPWPAGVPCWADLQAPDVDAAKALYTDVFGWTFDEQPQEFGGYTIATVDGQPAAAIGPLMADNPSAWTLYVASDDADATSGAVVANGGQILLAPADVGPLGRGEECRGGRLGGG